MEYTDSSSEWEDTQQNPPVQVQSVQQHKILIHDDFDSSDTDAWMDPTSEELPNSAEPSQQRSDTINSLSSCSTQESAPRSKTIIRDDNQPRTIIKDDNGPRTIIRDDNRPPIKLIQDDSDSSTSSFGLIKLLTSTDWEPVPLHTENETYRFEQYEKGSQFKPHAPNQTQICKRRRFESTRRTGTSSPRSNTDSIATFLQNAQRRNLPFPTKVISSFSHSTNSNLPLSSLESNHNGNSEEETMVEERREEQPSVEATLTPQHQTQINLKSTRKVEAFDLGPFTFSCLICGALHFKAEVPRKRGNTITYHDCCPGYLVDPYARKEFPDYLKQLFNHNDPLSPNFFQNIRKINSSLSCGSFTCPGSIPDPLEFIAQGKVYRNVTGIFPLPNKPPRYGQVYIFDTGQGAKHRLENPDNAGIEPELIQNLSTWFHNNNPLAESYKMMSMVYQEEKERAEREGRVMKTLALVFQRDGRREFDSPQSNEVAAVFQSDDGQPPPQMLSVFPITEKLQSIPVTDANSDALTYPLFFPNSETIAIPNRPTGFKQVPEYSIGEIEVDNDFELDFEELDNNGGGRRQKPSLRDRFINILAVRRQWTPIHLGGKLLQQFIVDAFCRVEGYKLQYIRNNQASMFGGTVSSIGDALSSGDITGKIGQRVILPSSIVGSPRWQQQQYMDAMSIVATTGKPDLFITFTCNRNWMEITSNLGADHLDTHDRPDLIARVFKCKMDQLLKEIYSGKVFGQVLSYVLKVEFQKRGLPHCHILLTLADRYKPRTPCIVDKIVSAEIPEEGIDDDLRDKVLTMMIHKPCIHRTGSAVCMEDGKCIKHFPKDYTDHTHIKEDGKFAYRRKNPTVPVDVNQISNRWVVPYNPYLLKRFNAHINVEICSSVIAVKYLYKYVYKGADRATMSVEQEFLHTDGSYDSPQPQDTHRAERLVTDRDEITHYINTRYIGSPEAAWRIQSFPLQRKSHTVVRLAIHLEGEKRVLFSNGSTDEAKQAIEAAERKDSTLEAFFKLNIMSVSKYGDIISSNPDDSRQWTYPEIPLHFSHQLASHSWKIRQYNRQNTISRMYTVSPKEIERYHLRLLLLNIKGCTSFKDLRTVNGNEFSTFQQAAKALMLLEDDSLWMQCLNEAVEVSLPKQIRTIFSQILIFNQPSDPQRLWDYFLHELSEDLVDNIVDEDERNSVRESYLYFKMEKMLNKAGVEISSMIKRPLLNIPLPVELLDDFVDHDFLANHHISLLNPAQQLVFNTVTTTILEIKRQQNISKNRCFFIDGPGGSGKTFVYNAIYHFLMSNSISVQCVAYTGIAATLLPHGRTLHSLFKLPVPIDAAKWLSSMQLQSTAAKELKLIKCIIWDEAPMASVYVLDSVDQLLRDIHCSNEPFGGVVMVLGGDFRQLPPVVTHGDRRDTVAACMKFSSVWHRFTKFSLTTNMRTGEDRQFAKLLLSIGDGTTKKDSRGNNDKIDVSPFYVEDIEIVDSIYGASIHTDSVKELSEKCILCSRNSDTFKMNSKVLARLEGHQKEYLSVDSAIYENDITDSTSYTTEFLNSLTPSGLPPHSLILKIGAIVMLIRNLDIEGGLCNGTRLVVTGMGDRIIQCVKVTHPDEKVYLSPIAVTHNDKTLPFDLKRIQFPIRLSFAMTINKSQGQSFNKVGLYLPTPLFSHGQLYVAMSRCRSSEGLKIALPRTKENRFKKVKNVVYQELLQ